MAETAETAEEVREAACGGGYNWGGQGRCEAAPESENNPAWCHDGYGGGLGTLVLGC
jgi:hypothetical protein